jgi:DNA-binding NtrC family response regulator
MTEKNRKNILILDPERDTAELFTRALESHSESYKCYWANSAHEARGLISTIPFNFVLADVSMLQQDRFLLLDSVKETGCETVVVANAYLNAEKDVGKALKMGAACYFIKPIMVNSLRKLIDDLSQAA